MTISWTGLAKGNIETAAISISNNDSDENPYQLTLNGEGSTISVPEMNLKQAAIVVRFWFVLAQKLPPYQNNRFGENMAQIVYQNSIIYPYWFGAKIMPEQT